MSAQEDFFQALLDGRVTIETMANRLMRIKIEPLPEPIAGPDTPRVGQVRVFKP